MHYIFVFLKSKYKFTNINAYLEITDRNFRAMFSTYFKKQYSIGHSSSKLYLRCLPVLEAAMTELSHVRFDHLGNL